MIFCMLLDDMNATCNGCSKGSACMDSIHKTSNGFTLVEVMIAISVMAILIFGGVPSFIQFIRDTAVSSQSNNLVSAINYARSEAIRRGDEIHLTAITDDKQKTAWINGWVIWIDNNGDGKKDTTEVLRMFDAPDGDLTLDKNVSDIVFNAIGGTKDGDAYVFTFKPLGCANQEQREIRIRSTGRPSIIKVDCTL